MSGSGPKALLLLGIAGCIVAGLLKILFGVISHFECRLNVCVDGVLSHQFTTGKN